MRARSGLAGARVALLLAALPVSCGGKTGAPCEDETAPAAGCGGSASAYPFEFPQEAAELCDELFLHFDGCGRHNQELCLVRWQTDDICDEEEEALLDCLLYEDGYTCRMNVLMTIVGECQPLARAVDRCHDPNE